MTRMAREIAEQPATLARTLEALWPLRGELRRLIGDRPNLLFVGRGTSDHAGMYGRYLTEVHAGRAASLAAPSLATHYEVGRDLSDTVTVCLSQSGSTSEIVATQAWAARHGARTVAVTNDAASPLSVEADLALVVVAGAEVAVPATKSYTAQLAAVAILVDALAPAARTLEAELHRAPSEIQRLLEHRAGVDDAIAALTQASNPLVTGRGLLYGTALEIALKLEETCLEPVRGLSYADLRHGPIAVVDDAAVVVLVAAKDGPLATALAELAIDLSGRGARTIGIGGQEGFAAACSVAVGGPDLTESVAPLAQIVPGQLIVEGLARSRGLDPDQPRGLSKVTQTDRSG